MPSLRTVQSSGGKPGRGAPCLRWHSGPHGKSLHPLLPPGKRGDDNTAPRNLNPQTESEDTAMRAKGPRDGVSAARVGGLVRGRAEPRPGPGVTGGRPTWAMADSQRLMLSVWRKCKPVACKGERARLQFSGRPPRRAQTAACRLEELGEPEAPAPRPGQTQTDGHHRVGVRQDTDRARNPARRAWGRTRGPVGGLGHGEHSLGVESACELSYWGLGGSQSPPGQCPLLLRTTCSAWPGAATQHDDHGDALRPWSVQVRTVSGVSPMPGASGGGRVGGRPRQAEPSDPT